jgi:hypothetical protein
MHGNDPEDSMAADVVVRGNSRSIDWGRAVVAGIVAMIVFAAIEMVYGALVRDLSPFRPLDVFGAVALGQFGPSADIGHTVATTVVGALVLLALGALSGVIIALLVQRLTPTLALLVGVLFGVAMYYVDMYGFAWIFAPLAQLRGLSSLGAYAIEGGLTAALYVAMTRATVEAEPQPAANDMRRLRDVPLA